MCIIGVGRALVLVRVLLQLCILQLGAGTLYDDDSFTEWFKFKGIKWTLGGS